MTYYNPYEAYDRPWTGMGTMGDPFVGRALFARGPRDNPRLRLDSGYTGSGPMVADLRDRVNPYDQQAQGDSAGEQSSYDPYQVMRDWESGGLAMDELRANTDMARTKADAMNFEYGQMQLPRQHRADPYAGIDPKNPYANASASGYAPQMTVDDANGNGTNLPNPYFGEAAKQYGEAVNPSSSMDKTVFTRRSIAAAERFRAAVKMKMEAPGDASADAEYQAAKQGLLDVGEDPAAVEKQMQTSPYQMAAPQQDGQVIAVDKFGNEKRIVNGEVHIFTNGVDRGKAKMQPPMSNSSPVRP